VHPGEVLLKDFVKPLGLSQNALAKAIGVPPRRINQIIRGSSSLRKLSSSANICFSQSKKMVVSAVYPQLKLFKLVFSPGI
jgi:DNA-binding XRE family transcriptional regulator